MVAAAPLTDEWVQKACQGDRRAIESLLEALSPQVILMVMGRMGGDPNLAWTVEDVGQSVMLSLVESLPTLKNSTAGGLKGFLSTIVTRRVADYVEKARREPVMDRRVRSLDLTLDKLSQSGVLTPLLALSGTSPLSAADRSGKITIILAELGKLKAEHQEAVTYAFFDQLTTAQISERMNISRPAASMLVIRALNALRQRVGAVTGSSD